MNDEDHDGHTINLGPPAGSPADERPKWDPREEDDWYPPHAPSTPVDEAEQAAWIDLLVCQRCKGPLAQPGALIFSPPTKADEVRKIHLCHWCYPILLTWLDSHIAEIRDDLPAAPPVSPPVPERLDVTELPEWVALVDAVNDDGGSVAGYRANVTGRASALTRAVRAAAADREDRA